MTSNRALYGAVKAAVIHASEFGLSVNEAAKRYKLTARSIRSAATHLRISLRRERRPLGAVKAMVILGHEQGMSVPQIAESSGASRMSIYSAFRRLGLTPRPAVLSRPTV